MNAEKLAELDLGQAKRLSEFDDAVRIHKHDHTQLSKRTLSFARHWFVNYLANGAEHVGGTPKSALLSACGPPLLLALPAVLSWRARRHVTDSEMLQASPCTAPTPPSQSAPT